MKSAAGPEKTPAAHAPARADRGDPERRRVPPVVALQHAVGNQAVGRLLGGDRGSPDPDASAAPGRLLHAHELAHVVQESRDRDGAAFSRDSIRIRRISFPHEQEIRRSLGRGFPFSAVVDEEGCAARRTPAFNQGGIAHFADERPELHVAAHEAAHQLQNAGETNDHGLGPEGHAGAVADRVEAGRSARHLIGRRGRPVASAERGYVEVTKDGRWDAAVDPTSRIARMSDTGQTLTTQSRDAWAEEALLRGANTKLQGQKSGIEISSGGAGPTVKALDGSMHTLSKVVVTQKQDPASQKMYSDCGRLAREIMGPTGVDARASVVARPGGVAATVSPVLQRNSPREALALTVLIDERMRALPGYPRVTEDQKKQAADEAYRRYQAMSEHEKEVFLKKTITTPAGRGKELGMDEAAAPQVGEAYSVTRSTSAYDPQTEYPYHWAAVIMVAGSDRITLENVGVDAARNDKWYFQTYGMAKRQTFHEQWTGFGADRHTMRMRTQEPQQQPQPRLPMDSSQMSRMRTYELFEALGKGADEKLIRAEVAKRSLLVDVKCNVTDDAKQDEIYVALGLSGALRSESVVMTKGTGRIFSFPLARLAWPMADPLYVAIWDEEDVVADDLIGTIAMFSPYRPSSMTLKKGEASYDVSVSMSFSMPASSGALRGARRPMPRGAGSK